jgi:hypothetical protein
MSRGEGETGSIDPANDRTKDLRDHGKTDGLHTEDLLRGKGVQREVAAAHLAHVGIEDPTAAGIAHLRDKGSYHNPKFAEHLAAHKQATDEMIGRVANATSLPELLKARDHFAQAGQLTSAIQASIARLEEDLATATKKAEA